MPEISASLKTDLFELVDGRLPTGLKSTLAVIAADEMGCNDNEGNTLVFDPDDQVDVLLHIDEGIEFQMQSKADVILTVGAFDDLQDRMANIGERMRNIRDRVKMLLPEGQNRVSITFLPIKREHWYVG